MRHWISRCSAHKHRIVLSSRVRSEPRILALMYDEKKSHSQSSFQQQYPQNISQHSSMAPSRPSGGRAGPSKPGKNSNKRGGKPVGSKSGSKSSSSGVSKPRSKSTPSKKGAPARKSIEQLTKGIAKQPTKKKRRTYTEKELGIPALNMITPAGVSKPKGKKKGKVFVDDRESMMTILAMVNADKEGQIESKMMKARQLEEIRQARAKEMEARQAMRKDKLVCLLRLSATITC